LFEQSSEYAPGPGFLFGGISLIAPLGNVPLERVDFPRDGVPAPSIA
jgi:hypothetical protein